MLQVQYISIDDSDYHYINKKNIAASMRTIVLGQIVASLLSLCMTKWLRKWQRGWSYVSSNTKKAKSLKIIYVGETRESWAMFYILYHSAEMKGRIPKLNAVSKTMEGLLALYNVPG